MKTFPVTSSILSAQHLSQFVIEQYDLSPAATCSILKTGINHTYLVADGVDKYVLRVYSLNWRTNVEIAEEIRLLNLLHTHHIPVSCPIPDRDGQYIHSLDAPEGTRFAVLFAFAKGEKLLNLPADVHYKAGEIMARMHQLTIGLKLKRVNYTSDVVLKDSLVQLKKFLPAGNPEMDFMVSAQKYLLHEFENVNKAELRHGAVHLDIWFDNMAVDKQNGITLFDFDFCGNGWLCYDVAYYILQLNSTEKVEADCKQKTEAFLNGYESVTELTAEEKRIIPMLGVSLYFFYLGIQCQRFDNWSNAFLNEVYLKRFIVALVKGYFDKNGLGDEL